MNIEIRRAIPEDAPGIWAVAHNRSKSVRKKAGVSDEDLSREGFLLYPLAASSENEPNYRERIEHSDHFWIAAEGGRIIAFNMAYTFETMRKFAHLTSNDLNLLDYFLDRWSCEPGCVYQQQVAVLLSHARCGVITQVVERFFENAARSGAPAAICEIAQAPLKNIASTASALKNGFRMVATRIKIDPISGKDRISGTFVRTLLSDSQK